jgi:hypothetical protein
MCSIGYIDESFFVLYYIGLIVLVFVAPVLGLLLSVWIFLDVLIATDNLTAAACAALLAITCAVVAVVLLTYMIKS